MVIIVLSHELKFVEKLVGKIKHDIKAVILNSNLNV